MLNMDERLRPHCDEILSKRSLWSLSLDDLKMEIEFKEFFSHVNNLEKIEEYYHRYFVQQKFKFSDVVKENKRWQIFNLK